ncbi:MAG: PaaI family thioesterase [Pseudobutyrivibrio sp.]|nr:PaaI family thioesterase [Pseudobutyrivibrio sp.]
MSKELLEKWSESINTNNFPNMLGITIDDIEPTGCLAHLNLKKDLLNANNMAHGGVSYTLADTCAAYASRGDGREYVTQQSNFYYIKAGKGAKLKAQAQVINRNRSICLVDVQVTDDDNNLVAKGSFSYFCISK